MVDLELFKKSIEDDIRYLETHDFGDIDYSSITKFVKDDRMVLEKIENFMSANDLSFND